MIDGQPLEAELDSADYVCTLCGCTMRAHNVECGCGCVGANVFMPPEYPGQPEYPAAPYLTIDEALAFEHEWHGIEPCECCGVEHIPVWWHVDFTEDSTLGVLLRARADQVIERAREEDCEAIGPWGHRLAIELLAGRRMNLTNPGGTP